MGRKHKILLVDDEKDFCALLKCNLEMTGEFEVSIAFSGEEALGKIAETDFDLVVTDYKMPGMTGSALLDLIREKKPEIPVIMITASLEKAWGLHTALKPRVDGWFSKPFRHEELCRIINEVLSQKEKKRTITLD